MPRPLQLLVLAGLGGKVLEALVKQLRSRPRPRPCPARRPLFPPVTEITLPEQDPADIAAKRLVGELALAVLAPAGPPQLVVLGHLEQKDKLNLGATCTSLGQASLAWFPEVTVEVKLGKPDVPSLAAWLERHQALLNLILRQHTCTNFSWMFLADAPEWACRVIAALPPHLVSCLTVNTGLPAAGSTLTALTSLSISGHFNPSHVSLLGPLSRLQQLSMNSVHVGSTAEEVLTLPGLQRLHTLKLIDCKLGKLPRALSALQQLTSLNLSDNRIYATAPLATLQRLEQLTLVRCHLQAVPKQASVLTCLTRLDLSLNSQLEHGWQRLLPLTRLQDLSLSDCDLTAVPEQVSALTALIHLDVSDNEWLDSGWQHLLPLTRLRRLNVQRVRLPRWESLVEQPTPKLSALPQLRLSWVGQCWKAAGGEEAPV
ncbi:Receptor-like protein 49 [Chlorella vulgaris]